jgi:uracil-DNA glycosylase family 4
VLEPNPDLTNKFPLTRTFAELGKVFGGIPAEEAAGKLLCMGLDMAVGVGTKNQQSVTWVPGNHLGSGQSGPHQVGTEVIVIGKMPGPDETRSGINLVGQNGRLLKKALDDLQVDYRSNWYATNVVKFFQDKKGQLAATFVKECRWFLAQEISLLKPRFLLLTGADAVRAIFKSAKLDDVRGCPYFMHGPDELGNVVTPLSDIPPDKLSMHLRYSGCIVFPTILPAQVLHDAALMEGFVRDLQIFKSLLESDYDDQVGKGDYVYIRNPKEMEALFGLLPGKGMLMALDCEWGYVGVSTTKRPVLRSIQISWEENKAACFIFHEAGGVPAQSGPEMTRMLDLLRQFIIEREIKLTGHNLRADALMLEEYSIPVMKQTVFDSMLADHMLNENAEHGLEYCTLRYTSMGRYDSALNRWRATNGLGLKEVKRVAYLHIPGEILYPYGAADADASLRIAKVLSRRIDAVPSLRDCYYNVVLPTSQAIYEIERTGIQVDQERMVQLVELYDGKKKELLQDVQDKLKISTFNPSSYKQMAELLFGSKASGGFGIRPVKTTGKPSRMWDDIPPDELDDYSPSTDQETLEYIAHENPIVTDLRDYKMIEQVQKSFLRLPSEVDGQSGEAMFGDGLLGCISPDGRVRTHLSQMSETGRHRSSNPNCFHPDVEFLTLRGWVRGDHMDDYESFAQYDRSNGQITFAGAEKVHRYEWDGDLTHVFTDKQIDLLMTPDHNCLLKDRAGAWVEVKAQDYPSDHMQMSAGRYVGGSVQLRPEEVILITALQADGSVTPWGSYDFSFKKQRKIVRFKQALEAAGIPFKQYDRKDGGKRFYIFRENIPPWWRDKKVFGPWLLKFDRVTLDLFADEVWFWDGCAERKTMFASAHKINTDWVQILTSLSGRRARVRQYTSKGGSVSWQVDASSNDYSMTTNCTLEKVPYRGRVYCVTMPLGTCIVRYNGRVHITCQCQNLPKKQDKETSRIMGSLPTIRSCFTASPGYVLIEADYKSAEVFTLAYLSNCEKLIRDAHGDLHARGAVSRFGAPKWAGYDEGKAPPPEWLEEFKAVRVASKTVTFGIPYQRGAAAIAREITKSTKGKIYCDKNTAQQYVDNFYEDYPEVLNFVEMSKQSVIEPGYLFNPFGRHRRATPSTDTSHIAAQQREFVNFPIQSTVADCLNEALINFFHYRGQYPGRAEYRLLLAIHDAVLLECRPQYVRIMVEEVIPVCMTRACVVPSWRPTLNYKPTSTFTLDTDIEVCLRWQEKASADELRSVGLEEELVDRFRKKEKKA